MSLGAGEITGIVTACTALIGAIATFIYKVRGKSCREILKDIFDNKSEEFKEVTDVVKTQAKVIKDIVKKDLDDGKKKK